MYKCLTKFWISGGACLPVYGRSQDEEVKGKLHATVDVVYFLYAILGGFKGR